MLRAIYWPKCMKNGSKGMKKDIYLKASSERSGERLVTIQNSYIPVNAVYLKFYSPLLKKQVIMIKKN